VRSLEFEAVAAELAESDRPEAVQCNRRMGLNKESEAKLQQQTAVRISK
jgi:hypothetical protein